MRSSSPASSSVYLDSDVLRIPFQAILPSLLPMLTKTHRMDKLEFIIQEQQNDNYQFKTVTILVNHLDIIDSLRKYEMPFAKKEGSEIIAGGYDGLSPETLYKHLTNPEEYDEDKNGKVSILECKCGCEGCWPMKIKAIDFGDKIIWTDFEQPHRNFDSHNFWDYSEFGQFSFDKTEYNEQLDRLKQTMLNATK